MQTSKDVRMVKLRNSWKLSDECGLGN